MMKVLYVAVHYHERAKQALRDSCNGADIHSLITNQKAYEIQNKIFFSLILLIIIIIVVSDIRLRPVLTELIINKARPAKNRASLLFPYRISFYYRNFSLRHRDVRSSENGQCQIFTRKDPLFQHRPFGLIMSLRPKVQD